MSLSCKAIIFDLDGVLVDSNPIVERHWKQWAERQGIPYEEIAAIHHGRPTVEIIREVAPHLDARKEAERKESREATDTDGLTAFDGAEALVGGLSDDQWTIATSGRRRKATRRLAHVGLPLPETLVTADDIEHGKPAPDPYLLAAKNLGVAPEHCLVLEDAPAGVESARRAGAKVLAVASTNPPTALAKADVVVRRLNDVSIESDREGCLRVAWKQAAA